MQGQSGKLSGDAGVGDSKSFDREVESVCPYCGVGCQLSFKIKEEKIAWVDGTHKYATQVTIDEDGIEVK